MTGRVLQTAVLGFWALCGELEMDLKERVRGAVPSTRRSLGQSPAELSLTCPFACLSLLEP
jgi:hypothetical protein